jgi:hypothetical protein
MSVSFSGRISGTMSKAVQLARVSAGLGAFLSEPVGLAAAHDRLRSRLENREARFLEALRALIYESEASPYRRLLDAAGCNYGDLEALVHGRGLESTLAELYDAGVYVTLDELKARTPIVRDGVEIETAESDFDSPLLLGRGLPGKTSGSRSLGTRLSYDWMGLAEEADNQLVLDAVHGVDSVPLALWFPSPPGVGGVRNVLLSAKCSRPPERWFSQSRPDWRSAGLVARATTGALLRGGRRAGVSLPAPEFVPLHEAGGVAAWLSGGRRVIRTMTSSALRLVAAAARQRLSLAGGVMLVGGEPMGEHRRSLLEASGARVVNRYATAEAGIAAAACGCEPDDDAMHLYTDRVAALESGEGLLLTSLSRFAGKVLLNASLGDRGALGERECDCAFGRLGMRAWISGVETDARLTVEGMTLRIADLGAIVARLLSRRGARPDDYQLRVTERPQGLTQIEVLVSPRFAIDRATLGDAILTELAGTGRIERLTAQVWSQARALKVVSEEPRPSSGHKVLPVVHEG